MSFVSHPYYQYEYYYSLLSGPLGPLARDTLLLFCHAPEHRISISNKSLEVITCVGDGEGACDGGVIADNNGEI